MRDVSDPNARYAPASAAEVLRLIREHPLAWVVSAGAAPRASLLPFRPEQVASDGRIRSFLGHLARRNPHATLVAPGASALLLFLGPQGYVSPSWFRDRSQAPTWNYASVQYLVTLEPLEDGAARDAVLADLVGAVEAGRPDAWSAAEMGPRYAALATRILAFRAVVAEERARFKLGQDERDDVYADITAGLARAGDRALLDWMARANPARPRR